MIDSRIRGAAASLAVVAALLLAGCSGFPAPAPTGQASQPAPEATQSQAQQCARVMAEVQGIAADVGRVGELLGTDPFGALALVGSVSERVGGLQTRVSDPALLERIGEIQSGWDAVVEDAQASLASGDAAGIERAVTGLTALGERVASLQEFCAGRA